MKAFQLKNRRLLLLILMITSWAFVLIGLGGFNIASAQVSFEFSQEIKDAIKKSRGKRDLSLDDQLEEIEGRFNGGLKGLSSTEPDAKALYNSKQKIRLICFESAEAKKLGMDPGMLGSPAETRGDYNKSGTARAGGTAVIAIECKRLAEKGFGFSKYRFKFSDKYRFVKGEKNSTAFGILAHELLHAANKGQVHEAFGAPVHEKFAKDLIQAAKVYLKGKRRADKAAEKAKAKAPAVTPHPDKDEGVSFNPQPVSTTGKRKGKWKQKVTDAKARGWTKFKGYTKSDCDGQSGYHKKKNGVCWHN